MRIPLQTADSTNRLRRLLTEGPAGRRAKVVLLSDNADVVASQTREMRKQFEVPVVSNIKTVAEAMQLVTAHKPQVVITELELDSAEDGLRILRQVKKSFPETKVVLFSGRFESGDKEMLRVGFDAVVGQPAADGELRAVIEKLAGNNI